MNKKRAILAAIFIILIICISALIFVARNTSFLNLFPSQSEITSNNSNQVDPTTDIANNEDFLELEPQDLIIPEKYKLGVFATPRKLNLPEDFQISVFANGLNAPRGIDFDSEGNIFVTEKGAGKVVMLKSNEDGNVASEIVLIDENLQTPHGIEYYRGDLYVAEEHQLVVYRQIDSQGKYSEKEILLRSLPSDGGHSTRTVHIGPDEKIYLAVGSSCNVCEEEDERRAAIVRYNLDGSGEEIFAKGLRNTVDFAFQQVSETDFNILGVDNGRDLIGDNIPPEEVNLITQGKHYGWPYCYGNKIANPEYEDRQDFCSNDTEGAFVEMQAHSAPLGISLAGEIETNLPEVMKNDMFIGFHGSWNRSTPTGYKVVRVHTTQEKGEVINFITGWLEGSGDEWGRPVSVAFNPDGNLVISDDKAGAIYLVEYLPD